MLLASIRARHAVLMVNRAPATLRSSVARAALMSGGGRDNSDREAVRAAVQLSEVMEEHGVTIRKQGPNTMAQCPFHGGGTERTPSMKVDDEKGRYHCFACQASGDVFTFLQEHEGLTFNEALQQLAERYAVTVRPPGAFGGPRRRPGEAHSSDPAVTAHTAAANVFSEALRDPAYSAEKGRIACSELLARRGIKLSTVTMFGLGYAPSGGWWASKRMCELPGVTRSALFPEHMPP
jgi:DNA primase